jgi:kumamolisin
MAVRWVANEALSPEHRADELAVPLSIAVHIEPELVRAIRLAVLPYLDVSAESDLWFSDLVATQGPDSIILRSEVLPMLRAQLADRLAHSAPSDPIWLVGEITASVHERASPALLLEERVAWLAAAEGDNSGSAIEDELRTALYALQVEGRAGVADWIAGAWARLPETARRTGTAWRLRQAAGRYVDTNRMPLSVVPAGIGVADLAEFAADVADVALGVRLADGELEIGDIRTSPGAAAVSTLDTDPRIMELLPEDDRAGQSIAVPRGGRASVSVGPGPIRLLNPRGLVYQVMPYVQVRPSADRRFVPLPGSERLPLPDVGDGEPLDQKTPVEVTLVLRRRSELPAEYIRGPTTLTREQLAAEYGADRADIAHVRDVLSGNGLTVVSTDAGSRRLHATGQLGALAATFGAYLRQVTSQPSAGSARVEHRYRIGGLHMPAELDGIVTAVLGLDDRAQSHPCVQPFGAPEAFTAPDASSSFKAPAEIPRSFTPQQVAACYSFPPQADGGGQTLATIELGGGFSRVGLDDYFLGLGIAPPRVTAVEIGGAARARGRDLIGAAQLGIEVAAALAPGATHVVYFAPNTDRGLLDALSVAVHASPTPTAICIGWGQSEDSWSGQARAALHNAMADAAALGVTVCVAAGDSGSAGGQNGQSHVYFPASSPHALACGGTTLVADPATGSIISETVWNNGLEAATGGGISDTFSQPSWQAGVGAPPRVDTGHEGRGVPDVAGNADPATGYVGALAGRQLVFGGTGAAAALWAALVCRLAQATGQRFGLLQPLLYAGLSPGAPAAGFRDITSGNNGAYSAGPGWDACTGLGVPDGVALLTRLAAH